MSTLSEEVARHCQKSRALFSDLVTVPLLPAREGEQVRLADSVATRATLASIAASVERLTSRVARLETLFAGVELRALATTAAEAKMSGAAAGVGGVNAVVLTDALRPLSEAVAAHQRMLHDLAAVVDVHHHRLVDAAAAGPSQATQVAVPFTETTSFVDATATAAPRAATKLFPNADFRARDGASVPSPSRAPEGAAAVMPSTVSSVSATTAMYGGADRPIVRSSQTPTRVDASPHTQEAFTGRRGYIADTSVVDSHPAGLQLDSTVSLLPVGDSTAGSALSPAAARTRPASSRPNAMGVGVADFSESAAADDASVLEMERLLAGADLVLLDADFGGTSSDGAAALARRRPSPSATATATGESSTGGSGPKRVDAARTDSSGTDPLAATKSPRQLASVPTFAAPAPHPTPAQRHIEAMTRASSATTTTGTGVTSSAGAATQSPSLTSPSGSDDPPMGRTRSPHGRASIGMLGGPQAAVEYERAYTSLLRSLRSGRKQ